jgi:hypothetical protein
MINPQKQFSLLPWLLSLLLLSLSLTRCSLSGSSGIKHAKNISYAAPSDWVDSDQGESDRAFKLSSGATVSLNSSCQNKREASLDILTRDLLLGSRKIHFVKKEKLKLATGDALFSHVNATVEGQAFQLLFVVTQVNDCIFDFSLVSPKPIPQKDIKEFIDFAKSFNYGKS